MFRKDYLGNGVYVSHDTNKDYITIETWDGLKTKDTINLDSWVQRKLIDFIKRVGEKKYDLC